MFIKILFSYRGERTQSECVIRANGPDTAYFINFWSFHLKNQIHILINYQKLGFSQ